MRVLLELLLLAGQVTASPAPMPAATDWRSGGAAGYVMEAAGLATAAGGATVTLRAPADGATMGNASSTIPADALRLKRVRLSGEFQTAGVSGGASLVLAVYNGPTLLLSDNGADAALKGTTEWTGRAVSLPVPPEATSVMVGVMMRGGGSVTVRKLKLEAGRALDGDAPMNPKAKTVVDEALTIARANALHRNEMAWPEVERSVRLLAAGAEESAETYPAIRYLLSLNDRHSFLLAPSATTAFRTGGAANPVPEIRVGADGVGVIIMQGYAGGEPAAARKYAEAIHARLAASQPGASCGWVLDLRPNTGGNMWPMLAGLKPFLGDGPLGTFESPDGSSPPWKAGAEVEGAEPPKALAGLEGAWVAVITGPRTASSGEAVTIAFKGRPHTRSFGLPTSGLSTSNRDYPLSDGALIFLTTSVEADRTGRRYGAKVDPDEQQEAAGPNGDPAMTAAGAWLKNASGCEKR